MNIKATILLLAIIVLGLVIGTWIGNQEKASCRARGGVPVWGYYEYLCVAPGALR